MPSASYERQLITDKRSVTSYFMAGGFGSPTFTVSSEDAGANLGNVEVGLDIDYSGRATISTNLTGTFADDGFRAYAVKASLIIPLGVPPSVTRYAPQPVVTQPSPPATVGLVYPVKIRGKKSRRVLRKKTVAPVQQTSAPNVTQGSNGANSGAPGGSWGQ